MLNQYEAIGVDAPDNDAILNVMGYNRDEKIIKQQEERISEMESDLLMLLSTIRKTYPLSISINLSRNTYHMIDYNYYYTRVAPEEGNFDELIISGAETIPNEGDREKFMTLFNRENLLAGFAEGERERLLIHLQTGDDGIDRWMSTRCIMKENSDGEIVAIGIGGSIDRDVRREAAAIRDGKSSLRDVISSEIIRN